MATSPVVDPKYPIDYTKTDTPPSYVCGACGASSVKLWREYQAFIEDQKLRCANCAAASESKEIEDIDANGVRSCNQFGGTTDQIGWYIPAVPTAENDSFWGYTSVPEQAIAWWRRLPTLPSV